MGMIRNITKNLGKKAAVLMAAVAGVAAIGAAPSQAKADTDFRIGINLNRGHDHHDHYRRGPRYEERVTRVWCPPVYRTVCERVWVPDRYETREVVRWHCGHRYVECVRVLVAPGHYETVERQVLVRGGHWEDRVERVQVADRWDHHRHHHRHDNNVRVEVGRRW